MKNHEMEIRRIKYIELYRDGTKNRADSRVQEV